MEYGSILLAAVGIGLLIFIHELGHFLMARMAGVRVEVFSLGFGPRLFGWVWRGTDFRLSLVPFGGFVMVAGQDPSDRRYPARESLYAKTVAQRALFWSGGVLMNLLFALIAFPLVFRAGVDFQAPVVGGVVAGGAAWEAGLQPGDRVVSIGDKSLYSFENLFVEAALTGGRATALRLRNPAGEERVVTVLPQWNAAGGRYELGIVGAMAATMPTVEIKPDSAAAVAGLRSGDVLLAVEGKPPLGDGVEPALTILSGEQPFSVLVRQVEGEGTIERTLRVVPGMSTTPGPLRIGVTLMPRVVAGWRQGAAFVERLGLRRGDVLLAIDGLAFTSGKLSMVSEGSGPLRLHVLRDGAEMLLLQPASAAERIALATDVALRADDSLLLMPEPDLVAAQAGLRAGDRIESVNGRTISTFEDLREVVEDSAGKTLAVVVRRAKSGGSSSWIDPMTNDLALADRSEFTLVARAAQMPAGITPHFRALTEEVRAESFGAALRLGTAVSFDLIKQLYVTMKRMVTGDVGTKNLGGIIRISQVSYQAAQRGPSWFVYLMAMLSLNLAFVNLLPIPVLDGGHLMFLLIEKVKGSPVSSRVFGYSQVVGLVFVLMLVLFVTYNDILQLL